jgi:DnaJ-class molecular chaperone
MTERDEHCEACGSVLWGGSCPCCNDEYPYDDGTGVDLDKCAYCRGSGYVNPLTASERQGYITGTEECEACDGTGHII